MFVNGGSCEMFVQYMTVYLQIAADITEAMAQWVRALAPQAEGSVFETQPRQKVDHYKRMPLVTEGVNVIEPSLLEAISAEQRSTFAALLR